MIFYRGVCLQAPNRQVWDGKLLPQQGIIRRMGIERLISGQLRLPIAAETTQHSHEERNSDDSGSQRKRRQQLKTTALDNHAR